MLQVVWFKRDLRVLDHRPLYEACQCGEVLPIYVVEPFIWAQKDLSARHFQFVLESLYDLSNNLKQLGGKLFVAIAEIEEVLQAIYDCYGAFRLLAHEEHGTPETFARDIRVHKWMSEKKLVFQEFQGMGVTRRLKSRKDFQKNWEAFMSKEPLPIPSSVRVPISVPNLFFTEVDKLNNFEVKGKKLQYGQQGGETIAHEILNSFLQERFKSYSFHISKPLYSFTSCSRLSPYLAWGNVSIRFVVKATRKKLQDGMAFDCKQLEAFLSRLHWHCHFIQRIEDAPDITIVTINPAFDSIRKDWDEMLFRKWYFGQTGIPLVDAVMRCLHQTGWINFRSRAMIVSFVCNTLWLDWRRPSLGLAQLFLDYEPGIHFSQMQMQAGTTGFNTIRIYNPIKMAKEHDPNGAFIKSFIPELRNLPNKYIHEPWLYPNFASLGYPAPIVDVPKANKRARELLYSIKKSNEARAISKEQLEKHGSRLFRGIKRKKTKSYTQLEFEFD